MLGELTIPDVEALTARMAIILACAREPSGSFNPGAIAVAIELLGRPGGPNALMQLITRGITGAGFYEYWQGIDDAEPHLRELAGAFMRADGTPT